MSNIAEKHVKDLRGLKAAEWRVAMALADAHNGKTGLCCPSVDTIAEQAGMSRRNAFRVLANLRVNEIIREAPRTSRYQSTHYEFVNLGGDKTGAGGGDKNGSRG